MKKQVDFPAIVRTEIDFPDIARNPRMEETDRVQGAPQKLSLAIGHHYCPVRQGYAAKAGRKGTPARRDAPNPEPNKHEGFQVH